MMDLYIYIYMCLYVYINELYPIINIIHVVWCIIFVNKDLRPLLLHPSEF